MVKKEIRFFLIIVFFFSISSAVSQKTVVKGYIKGAEGRFLRAYTYTDYLTYNLKKFGEQKINNNASFEFVFNVNAPRLIYLRLDFFETTLYIEKGKTYELIFEDYDVFSYRETSNPFLERPLLNYSIKGEDSTSLNYLIRTFDSRYNAFIADNAVALLRGRDRALIESFKEETAHYFSTATHPYFHIYKTYKIAIIEQSSRILSRENLFRAYFYNKPVHVDNMGYMVFFNQYFSKFFTDISRRIRFSDLEYTINDLASYPALLDSLGKDTLLRNEYIRKVVLVKGLGELWEYPGFERSNIISILDDVAHKARFPEVRIMATAQKELLNSYKGHFPIENFTLTDTRGALLNLKDWKGKYVYLFFWNTSCVRCMAEMPLLNEIYEKFSNHVKIVGVNVDMEPLNMNYFLSDKDYNFTIAHFDYNYGLLDNLRVRHLPFFILIDRDGQVLRYPAPQPSGAITTTLNRLINQP